MAAHPMLNTVKSWLNFTGENNDPKLEVILGAIDEVLYTQYGICVQPQVVTAYVNGNGKTVISLPKVPLKTLTSVEIDGKAVDISTVTQINYFSIMAKDTFTVGINNVKLVYTSGFTTIPKNLQLLYCMLAEKLFKKNVNAAPNVSTASTDFGKVSFVIAESLLTKEMSNLLIGYAIPII